MKPESIDHTEPPDALLVEKDKRVSPRINISSTLAYVSVDRQKRVKGKGLARVVDLSRGGLKIQTQEPLEAPYIVLSVLSKENDRFTFLGEITHSREVVQGYFHSGVKFMEDKDKNRAAVISLVKAHAIQKNLPKRK